MAVKISHKDYKKFLAAGRIKDTALRPDSSAEIIKLTVPKIGQGGQREDLNNQFFRSRWEANFARYLNYLVEHKTIMRWEYEVDEFEFIGYKRGSRFYKPDFKVYYTDEHFEYYEIKGYLDSKSATKLKRMRKCYPQIKIILIERKNYFELKARMKPLIPNWE